MPAWDASTPKRTGVATVLKLLGIICAILVKFDVIIKEHLREDLHEYVDALQVACEAFRQFVPNPNHGD